MSEYLVAHGKNGAFGRFVAEGTLSLSRGDQVVVETVRGVELGEVLCPANGRHVQILHAAPPGRLLRPADPCDRQSALDARALADIIFADSRELIHSPDSVCEVFDVEVLLDGRRAIVQYVGNDDAASGLVGALRERHNIEVLAENLSPPQEQHGGCGKPDCGRTGGGGCTTCGSEGGCGTCGSAKVDMRAYFAHLRGKMETSQRVPLA
jgi:hypothetical protein